MPVFAKEDIRMDFINAADVAAVLVIEQRNYEFPWSEGNFRDCLKAGYICLSLRHKETLAGYGILQCAADEAHILNLCIDHAFHQRGYARVLLDRLLEYAIGENAQSVFLEVRPSNPRAIELYNLAGFNEIGLREDYYDSRNGREDAVVMAKSLSGQMH